MQRARCSESAPRHVRLTAATRPMDRPSSDFALARIPWQPAACTPVQHAAAGRLLAPGARGRGRIERAASFFRESEIDSRIQRVDRLSS